MAYRNGTYVAFHAGGTSDPTKSDIKYYNTLKMWNTSKHIDFKLTDSHEKASSVRDSSKKETLRRSLVTRLNNSKQLLLILSETTKNDNDWVPFEISYAVDKCQLPLILSYPDFSYITAPEELIDYWPTALKSRIQNGSAKAIHIPFRVDPVFDAINQFDITNKSYPNDGYGYYTLETQKRWGLV